MRGYYLNIDTLRAGMIFIDAKQAYFTSPAQARRCVILQVNTKTSFGVWVTILGVYHPHFITSLDFHSQRLTGHNKPRRTGWYLDPDIPGNIAPDTRLTPTYQVTGTRTPIMEDL